MQNVTLMTFSELCTAVVLALATDYDGSGSDRTRDVPDARTIRYYTTLGLMDRPASFRGRTALYHRKHLLQLVAIKRLQAKGLTLSQIQTELAGISPTKLEQLANVARDAHNQTAAVAEPVTEKRRTDFWKQPVVVASSHESPSPAPTMTALTGIPLSSDVTLLLPVLRQLDAHDIEGLQSAAQPLIRWLQLRRILPDTNH